MQRFERTVTCIRCAGTLAVLFIWACGCGKPPEPPVEVVRPVRMMKVEPQAAEFDRTFPAVVRAEDKADLSFRVAGTLTEFQVKAGNRVKAGDLLARLDPRDFRTAVDNARSALSAGERDLEVLKAGTRAEDIGQIEAKVTAAETRLQQTNVEYDRQKQLVEGGVVAKANLDRAGTMRDVAQADVDAAKQELAKARAGARPEEIQASEARVEGLRTQLQQAEAALADTELKAAFDGVVAQTYVDNFQAVQAKQNILSLQNIAGIELELQVPESLIQRKRTGENVSFSVILPSSPGQEFSAEFRSFSTDADPQTQTYTLKIGMARPEGVNVLPGMTAQVRIRAEGNSTSSNRILVPSQAVFGVAEDKAAVWIVDPASGTVSRRDVQVGELSADNIEILGGLNTGEAIATAGVSQLREGLKVRPLGE